MNRQIQHNCILIISKICLFHSNESPAPATDDTNYNYISAEPPSPKPSSCLIEHAKCLDFPATTAAETEASENPDGKREDSHASGGTHASGIAKMWEGIFFFL